MIARGPRGAEGVAKRRNDRSFRRMLGRAIGCRRGAGAVTLRRSGFGAVGGVWRRCWRRRPRMSAMLPREGCSPAAPGRRRRRCAARLSASCGVSMPRSGKTTQRGYGWAHQQLRKRWQRSVDAGVVNCAPCGFLIEPGESWHLDHTDDRQGYYGPAHWSCNVTAANKGRARGVRRRSRAW